jgi:aspartate/methionine/tyrosine aminotransferase
VNERLQKIDTQPLLRLGRLRDELRQGGRTVFDFATGESSEPTPPFLRDAFLQGVPGSSRRPGGAGEPDLRRAAASFLHRRFGVEVSADGEVLPTMGCTDALFHLPQLLVQIPSDKDLVLYGEPGPRVFELGALFAEAWTYVQPRSARTGWLMDPDAVPETVLRRAAVVFLDYPNDPTGTCLPPELATAWVQAREHYGFTLVADERYADTYFDQAPRSLLESGKKGCLVAHSLTARSGLHGYRSGFLAGDADLVAHLLRFRSAMGLSPTLPAQAVARAAWEDDQHAAARRRDLGRKRELLRACFRALRLEVRSEATPYLWLRVPGDGTAEAYAARCLERGILVAEGSCFGKGGAEHVRVALGPTLAECEQAAKVWPG